MILESINRPGRLSLATLGSRESFARDFAPIDLERAWQDVCGERERLKDATGYSGYESGRKPGRKRSFYCKVEVL